MGRENKERNRGADEQMVSSSVEFDRVGVMTNHEGIQCDMYRSISIIDTTHLL